MARIRIPTRDQLPEQVQPLLDKVHTRLGFVPNGYRLLALSPNALTGYLELQAQMNRTLDLRTRNGIALSVSQANGCDYCLASHSYSAANFAKLSPEEITLNRQGMSQDPKRAAAVQFSKRLIETGGKIKEGDLAYCKSVGFTDREIVEMITLTTEYLLTNFLNNAADTDIDFPVPDARTL